MFFEENDTRTPRERVDDGLLRQLIDEGCDCGYISDRQMRHTVTRSGREISGSTPVGARGGMGYHNDRSNNCGCTDGCGDGKGWGLHEYPLAMVYSPMQVWRSIHDLETGFCHGTIFRELDLPFTGCGSRKGGNCRG